MAQASAARSEQASAGLLYAGKVARLRRSMSTEELARVVSVQPRQVQHWAAGNYRPSGAVRDRLLEVDFVVELLADVYDDEGIEIWLHARNRTLDNQRPLDLLMEGRFSVVVQAVERLASGAM